MQKACPSLYSCINQIVQSRGLRISSLRSISKREHALTICKNLISAPLVSLKSAFGRVPDSPQYSRVGTAINFIKFNFGVWSNCTFQCSLNSIVDRFKFTQLVLHIFVTHKTTRNITSQILKVSYLLQTVVVYHYFRPYWIGPTECYNLVFGREFLVLYSWLIR